MADEAAIKAEIYTPQLFSVEDIKTEEVEEEKGEEAPLEEEIEIEGKTSSDVKTEESEAEFLKREIKGLRDEILQLSARREEKPREEKKLPEKEKLSRTQIVGILKEHKDDPEVLLNVIDYLAEQRATAIKDDTLKDVNFRQWSSNLSGIANRILSDDEDGYLAANPKVKNSLTEYASNLGLADHPVGQLAAYAIMRLSESVKAKGEKGDTTSKSETTTTKRVMDKTRTTSKLDKTHGLTDDQLAVAKKFDVDPKTYAQFVKRS